MFYDLGENICIDSKNTCLVFLQKCVVISNQYMYNYMVIFTLKILPIIVITQYKKPRSSLNN